MGALAEFRRISQHMPIQNQQNYAIISQLFFIGLQIDSTETNVLAGEMHVHLGVRRRRSRTPSSGLRQGFGTKVKEVKLAAQGATSSNLGSNKSADDGTRRQLSILVRARASASMQARKQIEGVSR
jgi:hypothetical protein